MNFFFFVCNRGTKSDFEDNLGGYGDRIWWWMKENRVGTRLLHHGSWHYLSSFDLGLGLWARHEAILVAQNNSLVKLHHCMYQLSCYLIVVFLSLLSLTL